MLDVVPPSARSDDLKWYRANLFKVGSMSIEWSHQYGYVKAISLFLVTSKAGQYLSIWVIFSRVLQF